jgi:hypothetical protein
MEKMTSTKSDTFSKYVIKVKRKSSNGSFVWSYFGSIHEKDTDKIHDENYFYCKPCFEREELKKYKSNVATGNLSQHLRDVHHVVYTATNNASQKLMSSIFSSSPALKSQLSDKANEAKKLMTRQLALMCCRDLSPFNIVQKPGLQMFLKQRGVIKDSTELPEPNTIARAALNDIYDVTYEQVKRLIQTAPNVVGMTTDMWTDNHRRRSYSTYTLHFNTPDFEMKSVTLKTSIFSNDHTGENIKNDILATHKQFGLEEKKIIYVTDQGPNVVKACRLACLDRLGCVAHGLHNLVVRDGLASVPALEHTINKAKDVVKTFTYKASLLEREAGEMASEKLIEKLDKVSEELESNDQITTFEGKILSFGVFLPTCLLFLYLFIYLLSA